MEATFSRRLAAAWNALAALPPIPLPVDLASFARSTLSLAVSALAKRWQLIS